MPSESRRRSDLFFCVAPDAEIVVKEEAPARPAPASRRRKEWPLRRMAKIIGVDESVIQRWLRRDAELRSILRADDDGSLCRWDDRGVSVDDVRRAGARIMALSKVGRAGLWSPGAGVNACVACGTSDSHVHGRGLCRSCFHRQKRAEAGLPIFADVKAWCQKLGTSSCAICARDSLKHYSGGLCHPCWHWRYRAQKALSPKQLDDAIRRRRRAIQSGESGRGRSTLLPHGRRRVTRG